MFYNSSKIRSRSTELVGALFKGPRLKLAIGGAILLAVAVTATLAGVFTNISEAQPAAPNMIGFTQSSYTFNEGDVNLEIPFASTSVLDAIRVRVSVTPSDPSGNTAPESRHYLTLDSSEIFFLGQLERAVILNTVDNDFFVAPKSRKFRLTLSLPTDQTIPDGVAIDPTMQSVEITIVDDDDNPPPLIGFEELEYTVTEGEQFAAAVNIFGKFSSNDVIRVVVNTEDDTAISGSNFGGLSNEVIGFSGVDTVQVSVRILDDDIQNGSGPTRDNSFFIKLSENDFVGLLPYGIQIAPTRSRAKVTIIDDDDPAIIEIEAANRSLVPEHSVIDAAGNLRTPEYSVIDDAGNLTLNIRNSGGLLVTRAVATLYLSTEDGTATDGEDYTGFSNKEIQLSNDVDSVQVEIPILGNSVFENREFFRVVLSQHPTRAIPYGVELNPDPARTSVEVTIVDDDEVAIGFPLSSYFAEEDAGQWTFEAQIIGGTAPTETISVTFSTADGTATAPEDYTAVMNEVLELSPGNNAGVVFIVQDDLLEGTEILEVFLSEDPNNPLPDNVVLDPRRSRAEFSVNDVGLVKVGLVGVPSEVNEASGTLEFEIELLSAGTPAPGKDLVIGYTASGGSATAGADYQNPAGSVRLVAGATSQMVVIPITNDAMFEEDETFEIELTIAPESIGPDKPAITLDPRTAMVTIKDDNDEALVGFASPRFGVFEDAQAATVIVEAVNNLAAGVSVSVNYRIEAGSAMAGDDYTNMAGTVELSAANPGVIEVPITDDSVWEESESFRVILVDNPQVELATAEALVEILDDDLATISIVPGVFPENTGREKFTLESDTPLSTDVTLTISTVAGSATEGDDYTPLNIEVVFQAGTQLYDSPFMETIAIVDDTLFENDLETFFVVVAEPAGGLPPGVRLDPARSRAAFEIGENDTARVVFDQDSYSVGENDGLVDITIALEADDGVTLADDLEVTVSYGRSAQTVGSATVGDDYSLVTRDSVTLTKANPTRIVSIDILQDELLEGDETFAVALLSSPHPDVTLGDDTLVTIQDNDSVTVGILDGLGSQTVNEADGSVAVKFGITGNTTLAGAATVAVTYQTFDSPNEATEIDDYTRAEGTVILTADNPERTIEIQIIDDDVIESDERFELILSANGDSLPPVMITIEDDGEGEIGFAVDEFVIKEDSGVGYASFYVLSSHPATFTLNYVIEPGTATEEDLILMGKTTGVVEFTATTTFHRIDININNDTHKEGVESIFVRLVIPDGTSLPPGFSLTQDRGEIVIVDDDVTLVGLGSSTTNTSEPSDNIGVGVGVNNGGEGFLAHTVTLNYVVEAGSAIFGEDYGQVFSTREIPDLDVNGNRKLDASGRPIFVTERTDATGLTSGTITLFPTYPGETDIVLIRPGDYNIVVPIVNDNYMEPSETFTIRLFPPPGGLPPDIMLFPDTNVVTIIDNDMGHTIIPEITLTPEAASVNENASSDDTFMVTIPSAFDRDLLLTLGSFRDDDPATLNDDPGTYRIPDPVVIYRGMTGAVVNAQLSDDIVAELDKVLNVGVIRVEHTGLTEPYEYPLAERPSALLTIDDDDNLTVNVEVNENPEEGSELQVCITYSNPFQFIGVGHPQTLMVEFRERDANGELYSGRIDDQHGNPYYGSPVPLVPTDGDTQTCVEIRLVENDFYESEEDRTYRVELLGTPDLSSNIILGDTTSDITVMENNPPVLTLNYGGTTQVAEGRTIAVELGFNGKPEGLDEPLTVRLALTETSTVSTSDIDLPTTVTIPRGANSVSFPITTRADMLENEVEEFELALVEFIPDMAELLGSYVLGFNSGGVIKVNDDVTVRIDTPSKTEYLENEDVELTFAFPPGVTVGSPVTVNYRIDFVDEDEDGNKRDAAEASDITGGTVSGSAIIPANENSVIVTIDLDDDSRREQTELFQVSLTGATSDVPVDFIGTPQIITILDDEGILYTIGLIDLVDILNTDTVEEGVAYTFTLTRTGRITSDETVNYEIATARFTGDDPASAADFGGTFPTGNFVFNGYDAVAEISLTPFDDMLLEGTEAFNFGIDGTSNDTGKNYKIRDNDVALAEVRIGSSTGMVTEGGSAIMLEVALTNVGSGGAPRNLVVTLAARVTAASNGGTVADVTIPATVTISNGMPNASFAVSASDDSDVEYAETVNIYISHIDGDEVTDDSGFDLTVKSDDQVTVTSLQVSDGSEGGTVDAEITLSGTLPSQTPANALSLVLSDGTTDNQDVRIAALSASSFVANNRVTVPITLKDDDLLEAAEQIMVRLEIDSGLSPNLEDVLDVSGASTSFMLADADSGQVSITTSGTPSFTEDQRVEVTVGLPDGLTAGANITVGYELIVTDPPEDGKASAADIDGAATGRQVTIMEGSTQAIIMIDLDDSDAAELTEQLGIRLTSASGATNVTFDNSVTNVMILDNETTEYTLVGDATVVEGVAYTVQLSRIGEIVSGQMVAYTVSDAATGNDVDADDFGGTGMFPTGNFMFSGDNVLSEMVTIATSDDDDLEPNETFQISAGNAPLKVVTIENDDSASAEVQIGSSSGTVAEGGSAITLEVHLTNAPGGAPENLTIDLAARAHTSAPDGGTAADVTISPTSVTINQGDSMTTFDVSAVDDNAVEYDETVNIYVSHVNGAEVNTDSGVDLTVTSEDQITVESLRVLGTSTLEEGGMANVEITLSAPLPDLTPANALALVLRDSTYGPDVTIPTADIIPALKADRTTIVTIGLDHDDLLEADEEIELELQITPVTSGMPNLADVLNVSVAEARTSFTLADDDSGEVTIDALSKTSYSETDDVMVTVSLPSGLMAGTNIDVDYELVFLLTDDGGTERVAADAADIDGSTSGSVMIMAGDTNAIITIDLEDDTVAEETELLGVRLTDASGADVTYDNTVMQFLILDDEDPKYTLVGDGTVNESDGSYTVQARRRGRTDVLSVGYTVTVAASDSASAADFTGGAFPVGTFMFSGDTALSTNTAMIGIEDDMLLEDVENFLILAGDAMHPVMLFDNDAPTVFVRYTHAVSSVTVNEGEMVPLIAELQNAPGGATEELTVSLLSREVSGVTDSGTPSDVSFPSMVRIPVGASKVTFAVQAVADSLAEFNERVNIYADGVSYSGGINMTGDNGAELTVVSTDPIVATITIPDGTEGDTIAARITLNQPLPSQTQVGALSLVLPDGSISNDSVRIVSREIVPDLKTGLTADVMIELKDDKIFWGDVTVDVILRSNPGLTPDLGTLLPSVARASFKVSDNDPNIIRVEPLLSATEYDEGETVEFEFALPAGITAGIPITVEYELIAPTTDADNNRRAPADPGDRSTVQAQGLAPGFAQGLALPVRGLAQTLQPLVIQTGDNSVILRIQLTDDMTAEETELLGVRLMGVNAGPNARVEVDQQMDETVITILDNEDPVLEILGSGSVNEEDGRYIVRLRRLGRINTMGEKVPFTISGDGADDGDFVGALGGEFVFDGLDALSQLVILTLDDDRSQEDAKTFQIGVERLDPMTNMFVSVDLVDPVTGMPASGFAVTLLDTDVADFFGVLPPTGGPVLPVWLLLVLLLTGVALLVPTLRRM